MDFLSAFTVLDPKGIIALYERGLMLQALGFMLIVALPVYFLLFFFAWRYRAGNKKGAYMPNWEHGKMEELVWWVIPLEIVLVLGALTWTSTHQLDPRKPLDPARGEPLVVQVVALEWKWLFIYPEQGIASVNYVRIPVGEPVEFRVTADAPMNSFWIPQLGGQIYAMTGMVSPINLMATEPGHYAGSSANYSGEGFAAMKFTAEATPRADFDEWVTRTRAATSTLTQSSYSALLKPTTYALPVYFGAVEPGLFDSVIKKFTDPGLVPAHVH